MKPTFLSIALLVLATAFETHSADGAFHLKDGDRVVFYGDSITDQRLYTTFTETYVVTRFPKMDVGFVHSGWGGDRVTGGGGGKIDVRLRRDVFAYKPTVMTIMLGMNDASYRAFDEGIFNNYRKGYEHIVASVKEHLPGIRMTLIQPSPYDDVTQPPKFEGGYNGVLVRYGQFVRELALREKLNVADLNSAVVAATEKARATDSDLAKKLNPDRVHPAASGQLLMAAELLKAWNAPALVTAVEIDAAAKKVVSAGKTRVTGLEAGNGSWRWTQEDEALPMPVDGSDPAMALAVKSSDFMPALNQQPLKVTGLPAGEFTLKIDDEEMGAFTRDQLADGVNLAALKTPMTRQATEVHKLTLQHNNQHFTRWRTFEVPLSAIKNAKVQKALPELLAGLDEEEAETVKKQRATAQPRPRRYEITAR